MSALDSRLERLMPALSARERFLLELPAYRADTKPDPQIRTSMPAGQNEEFNHYLQVFNRVNRKFDVMAILIQTLVEKLRLHVGMVVSIAQLLNKGLDGIPLRRTFGSPG